MTIGLSVVLLAFLTFFTLGAFSLANDRAWKVVYRTSGVRPRTKVRVVRSLTESGARRKVRREEAGPIVVVSVEEEVEEVAL